MSHVIYRFFDATDQLLYVGCTANFDERQRAHRAKPWWPDVARTSVEPANHPRPFTLEQEIIRTEKPLYNTAQVDADRSGPAAPLKTPRIRAPFVPANDSSLAFAALAYWTALDKRDYLIRAAVSEGRSLREVAKAADLSHEQVRKIAHAKDGPGR